MKCTNIYEKNGFGDRAFPNLLLHDSPYFKILNLNFKAGRTLPVHAHDLEGEVSIAVIEVEGKFIGADGAVLPARPGDVPISAISEPHGIEATTDMRVPVTIAPPI